MILDTPTYFYVFRIGKISCRIQPITLFFLAFVYLFVSSFVDSKVKKMTLWNSHIKLFLKIRFGQSYPASRNLLFRISTYSAFRRWNSPLTRFILCDILWGVWYFSYLYLIQSDTSLYLNPEESWTPNTHEITHFKMPRANWSSNLVIAAKN